MNGNNAWNSSGHEEKTARPLRTALIAHIPYGNSGNLTKKIGIFLTGQESIRDVLLFPMMGEEE
ncbi:MAG: hypothetical protein BRC30_02120 [Nanohaloarchaea archaeon SW_7_46_7]|nr:MAG: hypothetical protein BRC30_02120 [Nanohaloarchaea archaeon SW_7_46_7]